MLNGLFDIDNRLDYLTENGDMLPRLKELVPWEKFRSDLEVIYDHERKSNAGRRPFDVVMMFKILILQSLYNLSDDEMEYQIMDRLSFMRFLDMALDSRVPDAKAIWLFRSKLEEHKLIRKLFDKFNAFLAESGFVAKKGQIVDATIVRVPTQRNTRDENKAIKEGNPRLKIGATRRSGRRTRTPAGFRRTGRITTATRTMWRRMSITKSFGITKLRMPPFTTAMCLKSCSMKATPAGMFMRTARIVQRRARRI